MQRFLKLGFISLEEDEEHYDIFTERNMETALKLVPLCTGIIQKGY